MALNEQVMQPGAADSAPRSEFGRHHDPNLKLMKKIVLRLLVVVFVLLVLAVLTVHFFLDGMVKRGVEKYGPALTKVEVKLKGVHISLMSGSSTLKGLVVGNPPGYQSPSAIALGNADLSLEPRSLFSDKLIIHKFNMQAPEITFETDLKGNNLGKILANLEDSTKGDGKETPKEKEKREGKHLQVDEFVITGGKINLALNSALGNKSGTIPLPEIRLQDLGKDPQGITMAELAKKVLAQIEEAAVKASAGALMNLGNGVQLPQGIDKTGVVNSATKGLGDLLKKK
jgi:uncharacterized protein involved in outer membrane biogenesis